MRIGIQDTSSPRHRYASSEPASREPGLRELVHDAYAQRGETFWLERVDEQVREIREKLAEGKTEHSEEDRLFVTRRLLEKVSPSQVGSLANDFLRLTSSSDRGVRYHFRYAGTQQELSLKGVEGAPPDLKSATQDLLQMIDEEQSWRHDDSLTAYRVLRYHYRGEPELRQKAGALIDAGMSPTSAVATLNYLEKVPEEHRDWAFAEAQRRFADSKEETEVADFLFLSSLLKAEENAEQTAAERFPEFEQWLSQHRKVITKAERGITLSNNIQGLDHDRLRAALERDDPEDMWRGMRDFRDFVSPLVAQGVPVRAAERWHGSAAWVVKKEGGEVETLRREWARLAPLLGDQVPGKVVPSIVRAAARADEPEAVQARLAAVYPEVDQVFQKLGISEASRIWEWEKALSYDNERLLSSIVAVGSIFQLDNRSFPFERVLEVANSTSGLDQLAFLEAARGDPQVSEQELAEGLTSGLKSYRGQSPQQLLGELKESRYLTGTFDGVHRAQLRMAELQESGVLDKELNLEDLKEQLQRMRIAGVPPEKVIENAMARLAGTDNPTSVAFVEDGLEVGDFLLPAG